MKSHSEQLRERLMEVLQDLAPGVDVLYIKSADDQLQELFAEIGYKDDETRDRVILRMRELLDAYQQTVNLAQHHLSEDMFKLMAQLEYPSRK